MILPWNETIVSAATITAFGYFFAAARALPKAKNFTKSLWLSLGFDNLFISESAALT